MAPVGLVGLVGVEPTTPALSRRCSNQLSYRPVRLARECTADKCGREKRQVIFSRKEVIQPHLPVRLPCYDFTPVMKLTVVSALLAVRQPASGEPHSHGVTGGVYKTRERIHRDIADPRLLAIPTSCSRVADCNPDYDALSGIGSPSRVGSPLYAPLYDV